jgi:hypothetical protein
MAKKHGKLGYISLAGVPFHITKWDLEDTNDTPDSMTTASNGRMEREDGISDSKGSFETLWDDAANLAPLVQGAIIDIRMFVGNPAVDNKSYRRRGVISARKVNSEVKTLVKLAIEWVLKDGSLDAEPS